jgi:molybdopterin adenylyltransferase
MKRETILANIGLLTVSDRAFKGEYEDRGGPALEAWMRNALSNNDVQYHAKIVPDEIEAILAALKEFEESQCCLVLTTGGTGPAPRDVTPEATEMFCERILDGFGEEMRRASLKVVPTAILSRQMAGTRGKTLVINLPGKPSAIDDCLRAVFPAVPYCIDLMEGPRLETRPDFIDCFRPQKKANK